MKMTWRLEEYLPAENDHQKLECTNGVRLLRR